MKYKIQKIQQKDSLVPKNNIVNQVDFKVWYKIAPDVYIIELSHPRCHTLRCMRDNISVDVRITKNGTVSPCLHRLEKGDMVKTHPIKLDKLGWIYIPEDAHILDTLKSNSIGVCKLYTLNVCNTELFFVDEIFWKYRRFVFSTKILNEFPEEVELYLSSQRESKEEEMKDVLYRTFMHYRPRKERCNEISK